MRRAIKLFVQLEYPFLIMVTVILYIILFSLNQLNLLLLFIILIISAGTIFSSINFIYLSFKLRALSYRKKAAIALQENRIEDIPFYLVTGIKYAKELTFLKPYLYGRGHGRRTYQKTLLQQRLEQNLENIETYLKTKDKYELINFENNLRSTNQEINRNFLLILYIISDLIVLILVISFYDAIWGFFYH